MAQYRTNYAPAERDAATVRDFLTAHNLAVSSTEKNNHYVTAVGRVSDVQNALNVQIDRFNIRGAIHRAATSEPSVAGPAGAVVAAVQVGDLTYSSNAVPAKDIDTGVPSRWSSAGPRRRVQGWTAQLRCQRRVPPYW
jgi:hypothetical protein